MKIVSVVGARPQFVKAAVVSRALRNFPRVEEIMIHTGQHHDHNMSDVFFKEMEIPEPAFNLGIHAVQHGAMTGAMLEGIEKHLLQIKPDLVLVYGDTNSTLAAALAAKKLLIPIAHVEAGLRSFNMYMPEEVNRIVTDRLSSFLFCPTQNAVNNLKKEGFPYPGMRIEMTGDVMQDAAFYYAEHSAKKSSIIGKLGLSEFLLCTIHRAENTDDPDKLKEIAAALAEIHRQCPVVLPLHPRTRKELEQQGITIPVHIIHPVGYFDMLELLKNCSAVITDSGGLQKEAFFFHRQCITLREQTEWTELVAGGFNLLAGASREKIISSWNTLQNQHPNFNIDLYGGGNAAGRIVDCLIG